MRYKENNLYIITNNKRYAISYLLLQQHYPDCKIRFYQISVSGNKLELITSGKIDASQMLTPRFNLEQSHDDFDMVQQYQDGVMKAMIFI